MEANSIKPETHTKAHYSNTVKGQKKILKATRAKWLVMYKGWDQQLISYLLTMEARMQWEDIFKLLKELPIKNSLSGIIIFQKM